MIVANNFDECKEICLNDAKCKVLVFNTKKRFCWLKTKLHTIKTGVKNGVLGIKKGTYNSSQQVQQTTVHQLTTSIDNSYKKDNYRIETQLYKDSIGDEYKMLVVNNLSECKTTCLNESQCKVFVFNTKRNFCWLKTELNAIKKDVKNGILGVKKKIKNSDDTSQNHNENVTYKMFDFSNPSTITASHIDKEHANLRKELFSEWMTPAEFSNLFSTKYFKKNVYPAYTEVNALGQKRFLTIKWEAPLWWRIASARTFKDFKKVYTKETMYGKKLLSLHIIEVDSVKFYSSFWVTASLFERERAKLKQLGISTPEEF